MAMRSRNGLRLPPPVQLSVAKLLCLLQVGSLKQTNKDGKFVFEVSGAGGAGGDIFENQFSNDVMDDASAQKMWDQSLKLVGL